MELGGVSFFFFNIFQILLPVVFAFLLGQYSISPFCLYIMYTLLLASSPYPYFLALDVLFVTGLDFGCYIESIGI